MARLFAGQNTTCALLGAERALSCWGSDLDGAFVLDAPSALSTCAVAGAPPGTKGLPCSLRPLALGLRTLRDVSLGEPNCVVQQSGAVTCWGYRSVLAGDDSASYKQLPLHFEVEALQGTQRVVEFRGRVLLGLAADGSVRCVHARAGVALPPCSPVDNPFAGLAPARQLESNGGSACIVTRDDRVFCAGDIAGPACKASNGQCPVRATEVAGLRARQVALGSQRTCALTLSGDVVCWGLEASRELQPVPGLPEVQRIAGGARDACALTPDARVYCWDAPAAGPEADAAQRVELPAPACELAGGLFHACAATSEGAVYCWGKNHYGQLGNGSTRDSPQEPVQVLPAGSLAP